MLGLGVVEILTTLMWVPIFQCYSRLRCGQSLYEVHKEANESRFNTSSDGAMSAKMALASPSSAEYYAQRGAQKQ